MKKKLLTSMLQICSVIALAQAPKLETFPLSSVRLLESPFKDAQQTDGTYILSLDPDRLLAPFLKDAGLKPLKENYGNWENSGLDGHIAGHYLSAVAEMYAATGNKVYLDRLNYMLDWLEKCQQKNGNGYVGGIPDGKSLWTEIAKGNVKAINSRWVPWYNIHKTYSGLVDAYSLTGSLKAKAILINLSDWCLKLTSSLSDEQMQQMLRVEHGGMNEVFANVADITGDKKYLELAKRFSHKAILDPLTEHKDALTGLHANTQIPKVIGFMRVAELSGDKQWEDAANFFWTTVTQNRSISIGGNSVREHFNPSNDFNPMLESREGPETCNSYNMLKLSKHLFLSNPSSKYMDYYERTTYNHILSSQNPNGGFVYFTPIHPNHYRVYSSPQQSFWCCVGSGIENHGKYGELIYAHNAKDLFVNLYIPSTLQWKEKGLELVQNTQFPFEETSRLRVKLSKPQRFSIKLRKPDWLKGAMGISVNNVPATFKVDSNSYVEINRIWKTGDVIALHLRMKTTLEALPDKSQWVSFVHGPIVLAAETSKEDLKGLKADDSRWGHIAGGKFLPLDDAPLLEVNDLKATKLLSLTDAKTLTFSASNLIYQEKYKGLKLVPFYKIHDSRYMLYWPYASTAELPTRLQSIKEKEEAKLKIEAATIDVVYPGEQQPESDHNFKGENTDNGLFKEQHFRTGKNWFSYELRNADGLAKKLSLTYFGGDKDRSFDILLNGSAVSSLTLDGSQGNSFRSFNIDIPAELAKAKTLTVLFKARTPATIANIFEVRLLKE